uniref:Hypothetical TonB domain-containing protein n=1 Tax=uncultured prokaryote AT3 TaxID=672202 RepID=D3W8F7_9ZZZZ|nr:hypothetical TonB domain-containing protein [uncultured prokaryote AT3]
MPCAKANRVALLRDRLSRLGPDQLAGIAFVLALHGLVIHALWAYRVLPSPVDAATVFVNFINPPALEKTPPPTAPKSVRLDPPRPVEPKKPPQIVAEAPVIAPTEPVVPPPPPPPNPVAPTPVAVAVVSSPVVRPAAPVQLDDELSLSCPHRPPPTYPSAARRRSEQGRVMLRVELDEQGGVARVQVASSSGHGLLDEAAQAAVRQWHCQPARRGGQPVRAVAMQQFDFTMEGR